MIARSDHESQVIRALGSIGVATLASRILGFVRDLVVARAFGAGPVTDAFFVAFRIPNILRRLLGEGALSTAVVPVFSEYLVRQTRPEFDRMFRAVLAAALTALAIVTAVGVAIAPWIIRVMAPGFAADPGQLRLTVELTRLMFPYLVLVGLSALAMGALNALGRFFTSALGPAVLNLGMIACVLSLSPYLEPPILSLAVGVLLGGLGQLMVQLPELAAAGVPLRPSTQLGHPGLQRIWRLLLPAVFGLATVQVTVFINTLLASLLPAGSISYLYYADRVMEFPLGVFGIALASASLPAMARQGAAGDTHGLARTVNFAIRLGCYLALPATIGLVVLREPITRVLFERGRFGPAETVATAWALAWYAAGLVAFSGTRIVAQAFYAIGEPRTPVLVGVITVGVNVPLETLGTYFFHHTLHRRVYAPDCSVFGAEKFFQNTVPRLFYGVHHSIAPDCNNSIDGFEIEHRTFAVGFKFTLCIGSHCLNNICGYGSILRPAGLNRLTEIVRPHNLVC